MDGAGGLGIARADAVVRPLAVAQNLGAISHFMLPRGVPPPPPAGAAYLLQVAEGARSLVRSSLVEASAGGKAADVVAAIGAIGAQLATAYEQHVVQQRRIDAELEQALAGVECRKGCSFCCHLRVTTTVLEVIRIAEALSRDRSPERRSALVFTARKTAGLSDRDRLQQRTPCPLLVDGACSIYEVRPLTCHALLSRSASLCEHQLLASAAGDEPLKIPSPIAPRLLAASLISGQIAALRDLGLASHLVELISATAALQQDRNLLLRWLNREDVFARA